MTSRISLRALLTTSFLSLGLILIAAYSMVSKEHFIRGLDAAMATNMEKAARTYNEVVGENRQQTQEFSGFDIASQWTSMPEYARNAFPDKPDQSANLLKKEDSTWFTRPSLIIFAMRYDTANGPLYLSQRLSPPAATGALPQAARQNRKLTLAVSLLVLGCIGLISWLLLRHVSRPMSALRAWTHSLDSERLSQPVPDFSYPELNEMAELIRNSLASVQQALDRERQFLRHASHELRTPISTIRSNIELQRKLVQNREKLADEQNIIDRIDRASLTMKHLTETLLWLNHEPDTPLQAREVDLSELIRELAGELTYLLAGKPVTSQVNTLPYSCMIPLVPARIILGNLIRNAYQHCWKGTVVIDQQDNVITITNPAESSEPEGTANEPDQTGYGLGLQLTTSLGKRIGWHYESEQQNNTHRVVLVVKPLPDNASAGL